MNELLTILKIVGLVWLAYRDCKWAYFLGYGDAPRNVIEPVKVLSTGERNPLVSDLKNVRDGDILPAGSREDLTNALTILDTECCPKLNLIYLSNPYEPGPR